jgi:uncharacterized membrane protein
MSDLKFIIFWWLVLFALGSLSLPLVFSLFKKFWDKGYIFSKIISLMVLTYLILIFGVLKILPFNNISIVLLIILSLLFNVLYLSRPGRFKQFLTLIKSHYRVFLLEESLFLLIFLTWSIIRGFAPDIEGLEKYMDWGFINSILRTSFLPPQDMWFAGQSINYYYFGHLMFAVLTKLSSIPSTITYNLAIATVCSLTFTSGFSLSSNLAFNFLKIKTQIGRIILIGFISSLLLTFGGNLHPVYKIIKNNIENNGKLTLTQNAFSKAVSDYWYPDATRFIGFDPDVQDKTIHEFPIYSFVVADLHGHMNDIPVILFFCAFLFSILLNIKKDFFNWKLIIGSGFILSVAYMTNAWDMAVYGLLFAITLFLFNLFQDNFLTAFNKTVINGLMTIAAWYLFTLPFSLNFIPMTNGLRLSDGHTPFYQLFVLYGGFWLITLPFLVFIIYKLLKNLKSKQLISKNISTADIFVLGIVLTATILIIIPEIGYIKDIYIYEHRRANTMFKLVYQAFIMYSLTAGYIIFRFRQSLKNKFLLNSYKTIFFLIFVSHLIYPYFAVKSFYGLKDYKGLDGLRYLQELYPDNFKAVEWINKNIQGQPVILEATGDSYTTYNQISVSTGLPTIEGWLVHEWLWRGGYDEPGARLEEVNKIYESTDLDEIKSILQKYKVEYIFVGAKEYEKFPTIGEKNFEKIGAQKIFQSGDTKIYKI